jgi:hypothetical protein
MPFQIPAGTTEAFTWLIGLVIVLSIGQMILRAYLLRSDLASALETLKQPQTAAEKRQAFSARMAQAKLEVSRHPAILLLNAIQNVALIGGLGYFFRLWMSVTAVDLLASELGQLWYRAQLGFLGVAGGFVALRAFAGMSYANTSMAGPASTTPEKNWLSLVADPSSPWAKLEHVLVALCFLTVFASCFAAAGRIISITQ